MSTANKVDGLDNMETMYAEAISYIDAITHSDRYYTEAETAAKYYDSSNDGTGSGLICMTLDGLTAEELMEATVPSGCIAIWSGSVAAIPTGWSLCDGNGSTPDLRDVFVVGSGIHYDISDTGGASVVTTTAAVTIADHTLTASEIPKHTHGTIIDYYGSGQAGRAYGVTDYCAYYSTTNVSSNTGSTGGGAAHGHTASFDGTDDQTKLPPYYAACYIMKD